MQFSSRRVPLSSGRPSLPGMSQDAGSSRPAGASIADTQTTRLLAGVLSAALLGAVGLPARRLGRGEQTRDSFPFSHYPMFSATRKPHYWVTHLLGIEADGEVRPLHYSYLGSGGLNAVRRQVRHRVRDGDGQLLADHAAALLAARNRIADRTVVRVHVVRGRYLVDPFMRGAERDQFTTRLRVSGTADVPGRAILRAGRDPLQARDQHDAKKATGDSR